MPLAQNGDPDLDLGNRIRLAMEEEDVSINELARRTGMRRQQVSQYVNGHVTPGLRNLRRMAIALGRPPHWFIP
jgi:transcriptional regulator with XRE-family HTH domain